MTVAKRDKTADAEKFLLEAERYEESGDFKSAFKSPLAGAQLEDSGRQANLGNFYSSGKGTRKSLENAAYWYRRAYRNGAGYAASNLAIDCRNAGNIRSAVIWFKKAIARKDGDASIPLAKIYIARRGGQKVAITLLRQALRMSRDYLSQSGREEAESLKGIDLADPYLISQLLETSRHPHPISRESYELPLMRYSVKSQPPVEFRRRRCPRQNFP
jgi:TPR repeat protein